MTDALKYMPERRILIIEPDFRERMTLTEVLENAGFKIDGCQDFALADSDMLDREYGLVIADIDTPGFFARMYLDQVKETYPETQILFLSKSPVLEDAVDLMKHGAMDFLVKPFAVEQIELCAKKVLNQKKPVQGSEKLSSPKSSVEIITNDKNMLRLLNLSRKVADSSASVLIQGESGTGKELFARFIHEYSKRKDMPFIALNCAALPEALLESELFGHEKGAFTGAISRKPGKFELAHKGTLFLDEITEMQFHLQAKLLRVIQEKKLDRLGGVEPVEVDVRILASTNRDAKSAIKDGVFREDLYYRLNTIPITIPPLRKRSDDLRLLCDHFIKKYAVIDARDVKAMTKKAFSLLSIQKFKGNVRELENIIHRAVLLSEGDMIEPHDLMMEDIVQTEEAGGEGDDFPINMKPAPLREMEEKMIYHTLERTEGNRTHAAKILGISVRTLRNKLNEYKEKTGE